MSTRALVLPPSLCTLVVDLDDIPTPMLYRLIRSRRRVGLRQG
jgi:hypothetical protein